MKRSRYLWIAFALCFCVAAAAMAWISAAALQLDRAEKAARRQAAVEENVRLALWRMDSALAALVARENARPYFAYKSPGPLPPHVQVYFQLEPETSDKTETAIGCLEKNADRKRLLAALQKSDAGVAAQSAPIYSPLPSNREQLESQVQNRAARQGSDRGASEFMVRNQAVMQQTNAMLVQPADMGGAAMTPLWIGDCLVLARRVTERGQQCVQGCVLDWPALKRWLLDEAADLLPAADLVAVDDKTSGTQSRRLAALPLELLPGAARTGFISDDSVMAASDAAAVTSNLSPIEISLLVAWSCILLAAAAVAFLLVGVVRLSERRATFVSAVTHELRTPLTTFKMYAEMLADGMVSDPRKRQEYLQILRAEADRLEHMVENVLAYARLENGRPGGRLEDIALGRLLAQIQPRLADRAARAGMCLVVNLDESLYEIAVRANPSAVDQILFNLVDNSCKYAANYQASGDDRRITIAAKQAGNKIEIHVNDRGPGIDPAAAARLFSGFSKSASEAAATAPGIGLGLALSRRLARDMGGDLRLAPPCERDGDDVNPGASFMLSLKIST